MAVFSTVHSPPPTTKTTTKRVLLPSESSADGDVATTSELRSPLLLALLAKKEAAEAAKGTGIKLPIKDQWTRKDKKTLARLEEKEKELARLANDEEAPAAQVEQLNRKKKLPTGLKKTIKGKERIWEWILDIETSDPDDIMMLLFATAHPLIGSNLKAVTITPGSRAQVALVRWLLKRVGLLDTVRVGAQDWPENANKRGSMQGHFYRAFGSLDTADDECEPAATVLGEMCSQEVTLVTGAPLHNLQKAIETFPEFCLGRWVGQGGFAGEGVVPPELQMEKFRGMTYCSTWNFGGNPKAAHAALACDAIALKILVSKNVCHRAEYDEMLHRALEDAVARAPRHSMQEISLGTLLEAMVASKYTPFIHREGGSVDDRSTTLKKIHDPLALATALDNNVCTLVEVRVKTNKGKWGSSRCAPGDNSGVYISIDYDQNALLLALSGSFCC